MAGVEFKAWPKIPRGQHEKVTVTEKIDGTNACIIIQDGELAGVQSRNRLITPLDDNYGFAGWVSDNWEELKSLGDGYHYGEWAGLGIQKNPRKLDGKYFYLFNTYRWNKGNPNLPSICKVVPILYEGDSFPNIGRAVMLDLEKQSAKDGYKAEGVVIWYHKGRRYEKYTFEYQDGKWRKELCE